MLLDFNGNIRASQACPKRSKPIAGREAPNPYKENLHPLPQLECQEERPVLTLVGAETRKIKKHYLDHILAYELAKAPASYREEFLKRHGVSADIRARMVA